MKQHLLRKLSLLIVAAMAIVMVSNSGGPSGDNTGSPNDSGQNACAQSGCHASFALNSGTGAVNATVPTSYYPGASYSITVSVTQPSPTAARYGFQGVFLNGSNAQSGSLTAGTGSSVNTAGIDNIRHNSTVNTSGNWTFTWTAPTTPETVTFYYSGNAANGNFGTSGDYVYTNSNIITPLDPITFTRDSTDASCFNTCDGSVSINGVIGGGGAPYTYLWSSGGTSPSESSLCAGSYTVTVTDVDGNTETATITVDAPAAIVTSVAANPSTCAFGDGNAVVSPAGGAGGFTYLWSTGGTMDQLLNIGPGTYTVTVTDAAGCTAVDSAVIIGGASGLQGAIQTDPENCNQGDGQASINMISGNQPYTYVWSSGSMTAAADNLSEGTYTVTVTDDLGCVETFNATVDEVFAVIDDNATTLDSVSCFGGNNGAIGVVMESGVEPYGYSWTELPNETNASVSNLQAGTYEVIVTDDAGCTDTGSYTLTEPDQLVITITQTVASGSGTNCIGQAEATVSGGTSPYDITWDDLNGSTGETATNLCEGSVIRATATDDNGCTIVSDSLVVEGPGGINGLDENSHKVYPNPTTDILTIEPGSNVQTLIITDMQGRMVVQRQITSGMATIRWDLSELKSGSYFLNIETDKGASTQPLLIQ